MNADLARMFAAMSDDEKGDGLPLPEAQIATLRELAERYSAGCRFKVGDLVTVVKGSDLKGAGVPHLVIEVFDPPLRHADCDNTGSNDYMARLDMRVASHTPRGNVAAWMVESWKFVSYPV